MEEETRQTQSLCFLKKKKKKNPRSLDHAASGDLECGEALDEMTDQMESYGPGQVQIDGFIAGRYEQHLPWDITGSAFFGIFIKA